VLVPEFLPASVHAPKQAAPAVHEDEDGLPTSNLRGFVDEREDASSRNLHAETIDMVERYLLTRVLREVQGNQSKAAERLGITRGSLRHKIRALGISIEQVVQPGG
jgi:two-component system nitrogen regulation response regulator GlnG